MSQPPLSSPALPGQMPERPLRWDVFCRVIDNHGDVGVCWRLSADLAMRGHAVRLWIDDASALDWMAPDGAQGTHGTHGVQVLPWRDPLADETPGDVVVEAFGCDPPGAFVARMAALAHPPLWINLEYLSAESYVERSHGLRSPQLAGPGRGLDKWFFYPGFTEATGGLLREPGLVPPDIEPVVARPLRVTLFSYDPPGLVVLRDALTSLPEGACVDVTPGWSARSVAARLGESPSGKVRWHMLSHVPQPAFDSQLRASDLNLVRGEDSLVRALWAGRPFVWQIYPQDDGVHADKLDAFLAFYLQGADGRLVAALRVLWRAWNGLSGEGDGDGGDEPGASCWHRLLPGGPLWAIWQAWAHERALDLAAPPDLVTRLLDFVSQHRGVVQSV